MHMEFFAGLIICIFSGETSACACIHRDHFNGLCVSAPHALLMTAVRSSGQKYANRIFNNRILTFPPKLLIENKIFVQVF